MTEILPTNTEMLVTVSGVEIDRGARFHGVLPFADWLVWAHQTIYVGKMLPWVIGDTLNYGEDMYGEDYAQAIEAIGLSPQTLANYKSICRRIPREVRRVDTISISTHDVIASLPQEEQVEWLDRVEKESLGREELRDAVQESKGKVKPKSAPKLMAEECLELLQQGDIQAAIDSLIVLIALIR